VGTGTQNASFSGRIVICINGFNVWSGGDRKCRAGSLDEITEALPELDNHA
jgi:hypothetical protein